MPREIQEDFKFFIPADFEKGKNKAGQEVWKIKGLASTADIDTDGEMVDPLGLNVSKFAFINYDHNKNPGAIIGHPTKASITKSGMFIEGVLYPSNPIAQEAYALMENLKKHNAPRGLGFSVEGKVLQRDEFNKKKIRKAEIRAVALCPYPKNGATWADIVKSGSYTEDSELEYYSETELEEFEKALEAGGIVQTDAADAGSGAPLKKESLEGSGDKKKKKRKKIFGELDKGLNFGSEDEDYLLSILESDTENLIQTINKNNMKKSELSPEQIQKAKDAIKFLKGLDLQKSSSAASPEDDDDEDEEEEDEEKLTKADIELLDTLLKKANSVKTKEKKPTQAAAQAEPGNDDLEKSLSSFGEKLTKSITEAITGETDKLAKSIEALEERLNDVEESIQADIPDAKSNKLLKHIESDKDEIVKAEGKTTLSIKRDKHKIVGYLTGLVDYDNMEKSENSSMAKLAAEFESTGVIARETVNMLFLKHNIQIVP